MSSSFKLHVLSSLIVAAKSFSSLLDKVFVINLPNGKSYQLVFLAVNFLHLTGVKTSLKPKEFYNCCLNASLLPSDVDCESDPQIKDAVKGKMKNLISIGSFFSSPLQFQEDFIKGKVFCTLASSNGSCTLGFVKSGFYLRPKTLLNKNRLNPKNEIFIVRAKIK